MKPGFEDPLLKGHNGREFVAGSDSHDGIPPTEPLRLEMTRDMSIGHLRKLLDGHVGDRVHREVPIDLDKKIGGELAKSRRNHEGQIEGEEKMKMSTSSKKALVFSELATATYFSKLLERMDFLAFSLASVMALQTLRAVL
jgi:hypothetical protein